MMHAPFLGSTPESLAVLYLANVYGGDTVITGGAAVRIQE